MNISNEQIIQSARRQRESVNSRMGVEPWHPHHRHSRGIAAVIAIAASFISFIAGYGVRANMSQSDIQPMAQNILVQHDTIVHTETVCDTIYQTRIVTKYVKSLTAQTSPVIDQKVMDNQIIENDAEQAACSMLCVTFLMPYWPPHEVDNNTK